MMATDGPQIDPAARTTRLPYPYNPPMPVSIVVELPEDGEDVFPCYSTGEVGLALGIARDMSKWAHPTRVISDGAMVARYVDGHVESAAKDHWLAAHVMSYRRPPLVPSTWYDDPYDDEVEITNEAL